MSDMTENKDIQTQDTQATGQLPQEDVPQQSDVVTQEKTFTKAELDEMLKAARKQEKDKLYKSIEDAKSYSEALKEEHEKVQKDYLKAQERLKTIQDDKMSDIEKVNKQIEAIIAENESLRNKIDLVSKEAENRIAQSQLSTYRQDKIKQENLLFSDLVQGTTKEEIDASIQALKEREKLIKEQVEAQVRNELKQSLPRAVSPSVAEPSIAPVSSRYDLSKKKGSDYASVRQKLMAQAIEAMRR
jgi:hypothetical protein